MSFSLQTMIRIFLIQCICTMLFALPFLDSDASDSSTSAKNHIASYQLGITK
jgi:hypothetical protein